MIQDRSKSLVLLLVTAAAPSIGAAFSLHLAPGTLGNGIYAACKLVLYGLPLLWLVTVARRPLRVPRPTSRGMGLGLASGLLLSAVILAAWYGFLRQRVDPEALRTQALESGFGDPTRYILLAAWFVVGNALLEEYAFRWFIYGRLRERMRGPSAAVLAALIFTAHHVLVLRAFFPWPFVLWGSAGVFVAGLVWTWVYARKGSVWPGYVSHMLADCALLLIGWQLLFAA